MSVTTPGSQACSKHSVRHTSSSQHIPQCQPTESLFPCLFLRLGSPALLHKRVTLPPHTRGLVRAAHISQLAGRGTPHHLPSLQELHLNSELEKGLKGSIWQACIGLQGFSNKETESTKARMQTIPYPSETDLFLRIRGAAAATPQHKRTVVTNSKDSQAQNTVIIF